MKMYSRYFLIVLLIMPGSSVTAEDKELSNSEPTKTHNETFNVDQFSDYGSESDDDDENSSDAKNLPENVIATMYENGRMAFLFGKFEIAYKAWEPLAKLGYSKAQASLGWMYHTGNGVPQDLHEAIKWYTLAANQNHAIAQNNLGVFYEKGIGVNANEKTAIKWYKKSAESGYSYAQYNLGRMYAEGRGTLKNLEEAKYWWRSASRNKVKKATEALANLETTPVPDSNESKPAPPVAHAPYHANPVAKGLAWVKRQSANHYTIQLFRSQDPKWILKLATSEQLPQTFTQIQSTDANNNTWYTLIYGSFPSFQEASKARKDLPESLQKWSPKLIRFSEIHQLLK